MKSPTSVQVRNALQVGFAGFLAASIYELVGPDVNSIDGFYLVYGAARSLLPTPEASWAAAQAATRAARGRGHSQAVPIVRSRAG